MAVEVIGDIHLTTPDNLNANEGVAIEHFVNELGVIQVHEYNNEMLTGMLPSIPQRGDRVSIPRALGVNNFREVDINGDRSVQAASLHATRVYGQKKTYDLDFVIKQETETEVQLSWVEQGLIKYRGAKARLAQQAVITALNTIPMNNSTAAAADGILGTVGAGVGWDPVNKTRIDPGTTPLPWNLQKLQVAKRTLEWGNVMPGERNNICLTTSLAYDGFGYDELSINQDYMANTFGGITWNKLGEFPNQEDGTPGGLRRNTMTVNSVDHIVTDDYIFGTESVAIITSSENPMFVIEVIRDPLQHRLVVRGTAHIAAMVLNPKGVVIVKNRIET